MGGEKKKPNPAPLLERQQIQSSPAESFLQSPLCFIFLPSHLLRIPSHSFKFFSRTRPLPPLSTHAPRAEQEEAALEGSAAAAAALSPLLAKSGGPEAATNSSQLLRIRWAKQHASCTSLLGAEPEPIEERSQNLRMPPSAGPRGKRTHCNHRPGSVSRGEKDQKNMWIFSQ
ncbi:PREDICTED: uncharacterized protein LOC109392493 isoform X2 [Hipposideros armiger]|uniref:Uncharacterized protein LOC109392493 isoform X2 n=1 Tax=Hipposideros armiger TaxID=186990 RepID=A0A8B7ST54_HIPAR|nr:PREDICTED: uncharacterized protein LOC109392493 isoform X2 [Hipposideros armiger]